MCDFARVFAEPHSYRRPHRSVAQLGAAAEHQHVGFYAPQILRTSPNPANPSSTLLIIKRFVMLKLKNGVAAAVVGIFCAGFGDALPTSFTQSHIAQHLFGGGWFNSAKSDAYQVCSRKDTPGVGFELTAKYAYVLVGCTVR